MSEFEPQLLWTVVADCFCYSNRQCRQLGQQLKAPELLGGFSNPSNFYQFCHVMRFPQVISDESFKNQIRLQNNLIPTISKRF
jgi:hypothetical protein